MSEEQKDRTLFLSTIMLVVIHLAGILGIHSSYRDMFLLLSPFNLLISCLLLFLNHRDFNKNFYLFCFICFTAGFFIEVLGVRTGLIFGNYKYGNTLGLKILNVPIIIGLNWLMLIYSIGMICHRLNATIIVKSLTAAAILVVLDLFIEPVAVKYGFWNWISTSPPLKNYIAWFIVSFLLLFIFNSFNFTKSNRLAQSLFIIQLVFFISLTFF